MRCVLCGMCCTLCAMFTGRHGSDPGRQVSKATARSPLEVQCMGALRCVLFGACCVVCVVRCVLCTSDIVIYALNELLTLGAEVRNGSKKQIKWELPRKSEPECLAAVAIASK